MSAADLDIGAVELDFGAFFLLVWEKLKVEIVDVDEDIGIDDAGAASAADEVEDGATTASGAVDLIIDVADLDFGEFFIVGLFERVEIGEVDEYDSDCSDALLLLLCFLFASTLACSAYLCAKRAAVEDADDNANSDFVDVVDVAEFGSADVEDADDSFAASKYLAFVDASDGTDGVDDVVVEDAVEDVGEY